MESQIRAKFPSVKCYEDLPTFGAFVVFDDVEACNKCFNDYKSNRYSYQDRLRFKEKYYIKVAYADDPININWENLEITPFESFWRSFVTILIAIVSCSKK